MVGERERRAQVDKRLLGPARELLVSEILTTPV